MDDDIDIDGITTTIDEQGVCGMLVLGVPHGVWTYFHQGEVRVVLWRFGELVDVLTSPLVSR
jgi:hypothetical protein